jgi:hypothetical protein
MGMFDYVKYPETPCKNCGEPLTEFQSKDGPCELLTLLPADVNKFYEFCNNCKTMNYFIVHKKCVVSCIDQLSSEEIYGEVRQGDCDED